MAQETIETPELRAAREARAAQATRITQGAHHAPIPIGIKDPLPFCIWTTVALLAWIVSPPLTVAFFGALGLHAYWRAWRAGLDYSKCILRDVRLVILYLSLLTAAGVGWTIFTLIHWLS